MDAVETERVPPTVDLKSDQDTDDEKDSAENFQKFIYELFEKNGVLGDLRAYLRKHIVNVLNSAHVGDTPSCQKHFAQRLELSSQALNMLIAEYLLRFEFSYSLSVFVSEIPLANMVFDFASGLGKGTTEPEQLRFKDKDIWSILNYLGVKMDSNNVNDVLEMYKKEENTPLLLCILKCLPMYPSDNLNLEQASSSESVSSQQSVDIEHERSNRRSVRRCRHYDSCKTCHNRLARMRDRWRGKKKEFVKAFEQLKMVYEQEVEMVRAEEEKKVKRSLASHAMQLMHQRQEMEEAFKAREEELERNVRQKKKFLWGLARSLREQHEQMSRAMHAVKYQTHRLNSKEDNLRTQLLEAEQALKRRGEDMRAQISGELIVLENHLEDMRKERSTLKRERSELEQLKLLQIDSDKNLDDDTNKHAPYDSLKSDLSILKKYIETMRPDKKCFIERSVLTDLYGVNSKLSVEVLNNENGVRASKEDERVKNQVVNDFKKPKNVNFSVTPMEDMYGRESSSNECSELTAIQQLRQENERLREYSRIQQSQISQLSMLASRAPPPRPRTAPPAPSAPSAPFALNNTHNVNPTLSANSFGWRKGAGEEISLFSSPQRVLVPGDHVPFIGVLRDRHNDTRRHLINQWRALRRSSPTSRRTSPLSRERLRTNTAGRDLSPVISPQSPPVPDSPQENSSIPQSTPRLRFGGEQEEHRNREKSPKSVLREAKENLKTQSIPKYSPATSSREKSPSSVLREAKMRLRKLEIEAEAVERSYLDFRKRQCAMRPQSQPMADEALVTKDTGELNIRRSHSSHKMEKFTGESSRGASIKSTDDIDKYLRNYRDKYDLGETHFINRNTVYIATNPIPQAFSTKPPENKPTDNINVNNLLETPLVEFRKYYRPQTSTPKTDDRTETRAKSPVKESETQMKSPLRDIEVVETENVEKLENILEAKKDALIKAKNCKKAELEILKQNINKMYNVVDNEPEPTVIEIKEDSLEIAKVDNNVLMIEVENVNEVSAINVMDNDDPQDILVVVESNVEAAAIPPSDTESEKEKEAMSGNMTILISPKSVTEIREASRPKSPDKSRRSVSPEQAARLTRNDVFEAIFHADHAKAESSHEIHADSSKDPIDDSNSDAEKEPLENYTDDFSADVDNYNTSGIRSPISLPKSPTEDNFWDT